MTPSKPFSPGSPATEENERSLLLKTLARVDVDLVALLFLASVTVSTSWALLAAWGLRGTILDLTSVGVVSFCVITMSTHLLVHVLNIVKEGL